MVYDGARYDVYILDTGGCICISGCTLGNNRDDLRNNENSALDNLEGRLAGGEIEPSEYKECRKIRYNQQVRRGILPA